MKIFREKQARWQRAGSHKGLIQNKRSLSESDPFKNGVYCNGLDIEIDGLTDCLEVRSTGETVETEFGPIKMTPTLQRKLKRERWRFDWTKAEGENLFALRVKGEDIIQELISFSHEQGFTRVFLVESNPINVSHEGKYKGIGGHLFAIAYYESKKHGNDGIVTMTAKTKLVDHYAKTLGAHSLGAKENMAIDELAAQKLIDKYIRKQYNIYR